MHQKKCVLICDDDPAILEVCQLILDNDYRVETRINCDDIIEHIRRTNPGVILMDIMLPGGGDEATRLIRQTDDVKHIPVIVFSAISDVEKLRESLNASAVLEKPFDIEALRETIEEHIL